jgi:hypothetical protein
MIAVSPKPHVRPPDAPDPLSSERAGPAAEARSLDAEAAALLADIDSFDLEAARRRVEQIDARYTGIRGNTADFSVAARDLGFPEVTGLRASVPEPTRRFRPEVPEQLRSGLLDQLRDEVALRQRGASMASREAERLRERLDRSCARCSTTCVI